MEVGVIVPAAGSGKRFGSAIKKQYLSLGGVPVLIRTLRVFIHQPDIKAIIAVIPQDELGETESLLKAYGLADRVTLVLGGAERYDSVKNGLHALPRSITHVLIHDGARPLATQALISRCIEAFQYADGFTAAIPSRDTVKRVAAALVIETLKRDELVLVQTPQGFKKNLLMDCYDHMDFSVFQVTDDAALFEYFKMPVAIVMGEESNIKVTTPIDLVFGKAILEERGEGP